MGNRPVIIRTFDLGADKMPHLPASRGRAQPVPRPAEHPPGAAQFADVPHAVSRGPAGQRLGNVQIMFPLVSTLLELRQAKMVLADVMEDLDEHKSRSTATCRWE